MRLSKFLKTRLFKDLEVSKFVQYASEEQIANELRKAQEFGADISPEEVAIAGYRRLQNVYDVDMLYEF